MYRAEITDEAERDLQQLDKSVAKRIYKRLKWLEENFERLVPEPLSGSLADFINFVLAIIVSCMTSCAKTKCF